MNFCSHFRSQNLLGLSFYSTSTKTAFPRKSWNGSLGALYRKISKIEDPNAMPSIFPVLDKWILDGRVVDRSSLLGFIKEFRRIRRYNHALQVTYFLLSFLALRALLFGCQETVGKWISFMFTSFYYFEVAMNVLRKWECKSAFRKFWKF